VLNFKIGEVQFGFASSEERNSGTGRGKTEGESLPDTATGAGDENALALYVARTRQCLASASTIYMPGALTNTVTLRLDAA
jgi:hypothetical protein